MLNTSQTQTKLSDLANQIESSDSGAATRLRDLGSALGGGSSTRDAWATSDLTNLINPIALAKSAAARRSSGITSFIGIIEIFRNVMVLLPLVVTWWGISRALEAYTSLISSDTSQATRSFLYLWQNGFNGALGSGLTLGRLAWIDGVLLGFVVLLTFFVYALNLIVNNDQERQAQLLRGELEQALAEATLQLAPYRQNQTIYSFTKIQSQTQDMLQQISTLSQFNAGLLQTATDMQNAATIFQNTQANLDGNVKDLSKSFTRLIRLQEPLIQSTEVMASSVNQIAGDQNRLVNNLESMSITQEKTARNLDTVETRSRGMMTQAEDTFKELKEVTERLFAGQAQMLDAIVRERQAQEALGKNISEASFGLKGALDGVQSSSTSIHSIAVDLAKISNELRALRSNLT